MSYFLIGADICPTDSNYAFFENGDMESFISPSLIHFLNDALYRVANLETPICDCLSPINKYGPSLRTPTKCINGLLKLKIDLLCLANNHIMDHGLIGLNSTISSLDLAGIKHVGAGNTVEEAESPYLFMFENKLVGVYACAEHEFSIITNEKPGANPFNPFNSLIHIEKIREQCDFLIVLYHGGKEFYRFPSPNLQERCRKMIDAGADLVLCQHSHCVGCFEEYMDKTIVYGQGNFIFDSGKTEYWKSAILVSVDSSLKVSFIPIEMEQGSLRLAEKSDIMSQFYERSEQMKDPMFLQMKYDEFCYNQIWDYIYVLSGKKGFFFRAINKLTRYKFGRWFLDRRYDNKILTAFLNYIECESHNEVITNGLRLLVSQKR